MQLREGMETWKATTTADCHWCKRPYRLDEHGRRESDWICSDQFCCVTCNIEARGTRRYGEIPLDSWKTPISDGVRSVCDEHFNKTDAGCARCPIRVACHSGPTGNLTFERMEEWRLRLNGAAADHLLHNTEGEHHAK